MQQQPFLHVERVPGAVDSCAWQGVFAVLVTSCPALRSQASWNDETQAVSRHVSLFIDFLNAAYSPDPLRTYAIRIVSRPHPSSFAAGTVEVAILAQIRGDSAEAARSLAMQQAGELLPLVGGLLPDYGWCVVTDPSTFQRIWEPMDWDTAQVGEIRRRQEVVPLHSPQSRPSLGAGRSSAAPDANDGRVLLVHHFRPRCSAFDRLFRTMLLQRVPVLWQVTLTPTRLTESERRGITTEIAKCERSVQQRHTGGANGPSATSYEARANVVRELLVHQLARLDDAPFAMTISMASPENLPRMLLEAAGVQLTEPVGSQPGASDSRIETLTGGYDVVCPDADAEWESAKSNLRWLTSSDWGQNIAPTSLSRLVQLVDATEAAAAFRLPVATTDGLPGMDVRTTRQRPLPREVAEVIEQTPDGDRLLLGENRHLGFSQPAYLRDKDRRQHVYVVGQTGTGKTTLLKQMALSDMQAGKGLAVIDPHGDLFHELLQLIPEHRWKDVVLLDPTDIEFPVGLNFLECRKESDRHFVVRQMKAIMERLTHDQYGAASSEWMGPSFFQHMQMNLLLVMSDSEHPGTLLEFYELFQHKEFWKRWLPLKWSDQMLERWVAKNLPGMDYTHRPKGETSCTWGEYLSTKFDDFVFDPRLRRMFGQRRSTIDFRTIMDEGKILLVNLAKGDLSEANSRFLGMALMARIQAAAMSRISLPPEQRRTFYLYVDEFQSLATENFLVMLSEARKFGVGLVLANQFVSQIKDERIMQSVFGNAGTVVSFRVGQEDAQILEPRFMPHFDRFDLTNLPNWQACVKATVDGNVTTPFTLHTLPPPQPTNPRQPQLLRKMSRKKYAKPRDQVDFEIVLSLSPDRSLPAGVVPPEGMLELQNVMCQSREPTEDDVDHEREEGDDSPQEQGPPPPPPGVDPSEEMGFDDEDLRVLASVGDYRFGSIMDTLTTDHITISDHPDTTFDEHSFVKKLRGSISVSTDEKWRILLCIPKMSQFQIDQLERIYDEEFAKFSCLSPKHLRQLKVQESRHAEEWVQLQQKLATQSK